MLVSRASAATSDFDTSIEMFSITCQGAIPGGWAATTLAASRLNGPENVARCRSTTRSDSVNSS